MVLTTYTPVYAPREQLDSIDLETKFPPRVILPCHNELAYNPWPAGQIAPYCLREDGGETIIVWNSEITELVQPELLDFLEAHYEFSYHRTYHHAQQLAPHPGHLAAGLTAFPADQGLAWEGLCWPPCLFPTARLCVSCRRTGSNQ